MKKELMGGPLRAGVDVARGILGVPWSPTSNSMLASHGVATGHRDSWVEPGSTAG